MTEITENASQAMDKPRMEKPCSVNPCSVKPCLVLLHGWGLNQAVWRGILPLLPSDQSVLCLDLPGFGWRQSWPEPYTLAAIAESLLAEIPPQSLLVGWSLGGLVAQQIALQAPEKVKALALVASSPCFVAKPASAEGQGWPGMSAEVLAQFASALAQDPAKTIERFLAIQAMGSQSARQDIKSLKEAVMELPAPAAEALAGGLSILANSDYRPLLSALSCPVSACFGRLDSLVPVSVATEFAAILPNASIEVFPSASHAPFISHPSEFIGWLNAWIARSVV